MVELRTEKAICIPPLKFQIESFDDIGAVISSQGNQPQDAEKSDLFRESVRRRDEVSVLPWTNPLLFQKS
jgi:hypothetical protein